MDSGKRSEREREGEVKKEKGERRKREPVRNSGGR